MADLLDVIQRLQETEAALTHLRGVAAENPHRPTLRTSIASLHKRYQSLERLFAALAAEQHLDVCSYRLVAEDNKRYTLSSLANTLGNFQSTLTLVYDAIKSGQRKIKAAWSAEIANETALNFGYTYSGSLGFIFTMPNERLLLVESELDMAFQSVFEMVRADSPDALAKYAKALGPAPIRTLYQWATDHVQAGLSADITWRRGEEVRASLVAQKPQLERLREFIEKTGDETEEWITVKGILLGGDLKTLTFRLNPESGEEIRGRMDEAFVAEEELRLGHGYTAELRKVTRTHYSIEKEDVSWYLQSLK
jgi:hypothetical protein